ncbi:MAG TPA: TipAS antibiotic-recognition domain-containing protein, partial [Actinomycetota bacterium]|nr:TipAS antibiotic-recognition domain-containing protein [Actinomycetota bacterium]
MRMGIDLTPEERFELWGDFDPAEHVAEAGQHWGDTEAYHESARRTSRYTKQDWSKIKSEAGA